MHQNPINFKLLQNQIFTESSMVETEENGPRSTATSTLAATIESNNYNSKSGDDEDRPRSDPKRK